MPTPLVPPPANDTGALTMPRQLQKWLDVNPITKLDRVGSYITLPTFSVVVNWRGYSDIVAAFNFEGPNNFSLKSLSVLPISPNYMLCVMWKDSANVTHRYAIWKNVGEVLYFDIPLYTGQLIKKNFRFEVWSTNSNPSVQTSAISFTTSVLGKLDYRYGNDFQLVGTDGQVSNFGSNYNPISIPKTNLWAQWRGNNGISGNNWNVAQSPVGVTSMGCGIALTTTDWNDLNFNNAINNISGGNCLSTPQKAMSGVCTLFALVKPNTMTTNNYWFSISPTGGIVIDWDVALISQGGNVLQLFDGVHTQNLSGTVVLGAWNIIVLVLDMTGNTMGGYVIPLSVVPAEIAFSTNTAVYSPAPQTLSIGVSNGSPAYPTEDFQIAELDYYTTSSDVNFRNSVLAALGSFYGAVPFPLPLTFPTNSSPQPN